MDKWEWIDKYYPDVKSSKNKCREAATEMAQAFDDLTLQVGFLHGVFHCWCKDPYGTIFDPTFRQFSKPTSEVDYILAANHLLRKDQVDVSTGVIFLDDGRVVLAS